MRKVLSFILGWSIILQPSFLLAGENESPLADTKRLDGVTVEAVETYVNPKSFEISLGAGIFPLDPYFLGFSMNGGISYYINNSWAWEIISGSYAFAVQKDLTAQLAQTFNVNPEVIEKLQYLVSTNIVFFPTYGKTVFFKKFIQYIRSGYFLGPGLVKTSLNTDIALTVGAHFDTYINETFSWRIEVRDSLTIPGGKNFLSLNLGTGIYF